MAEGLARPGWLEVARIEPVAAEITVGLAGPALLYACCGPASGEDLIRAGDARLSGLERDFRNGWTIERLAREVGIDEKPLEYGFRDRAGQPVHAHLAALLLDAAARLLRQGVSAAVSVGFGTLSDSINVFRENKGLSSSRFTRLR